MRRRHKILLTLGVVLASVALVAGLYHGHLKAVNEAYIAQLVAQGEPMSLAQVLPPPVPPADNHAALFLRATALLAADSSLLHTDSCRVMQMTAPGQALVCSQLPTMAGYDATNAWPVLDQALLTNQPALSLLLKLADHATCDFHISYDGCFTDPRFFTNLHLVEFRKAEKYLKAQIVYSLHQADLATAVQSQRALLALVQATQNQRLQISQWVRLAMVHGLQNTCWEILQTPGITEAQLAQLQTDWEQLDFIDSAQQALAMERAVGELTLADWRNSPAAFRQYLDLGKSARIVLGMPDTPESLWVRGQANLKIFLWRYWWSYPDEFRALQGYQVLLGAARLTSTNGSFINARARQATGLAALRLTNLPDEFSALFDTMSSGPDFHSMLSSAIVSLAPTLDKVLSAETTRQITIAALALQRFKLALGHFPTHLAELVPAYVTSLPRDPVDGQSLRYRLQTDGKFLLYSVGENGLDDGGNPACADHSSEKSLNWLARQNLDWVWPQPVARPPTLKYYDIPNS